MFHAAIATTLLVLSVCAWFGESKSGRTNVIIILADDLGYGDTGVAPFTGLGVKTPHLQRMASKGTILTNYHTAAATCTPTRASILTGMYPWRMGIKAVYEYGERGQSNRDDFLPPLPTLPSVLRESNYSVFHSGKWHLGGMRNDDLTLRTAPPTARRCPHPGPLQQGFDGYCSVLDGPGAPRQNQLQMNSRLYSMGCDHMLYNDFPMKQGNFNITGYLTFCETQHAILAINRSVEAKKPFFINLWYHCPHGPIEEIPGWRHILTGPGANKPSLEMKDSYITMIADMDLQIGRLLKHLERLGIENDTMVVFTSDNGPEHFAGTTAGFKGQKRFLYEGGIRVPAIVQWPGTIPAGKKSGIFAVSTDWYPTFLDAAGVALPSHVRLDGLSLLPQLIPKYYEHFRPPSAVASTVSSASSPREESVSAVAAAGPVIHAQHNRPKGHVHAPNAEDIRNNKDWYETAIRDRITLWHNDYEGPRRTAAWVYDYKLILNENEVMSEMYDMKNDKFEKVNLLQNTASINWQEFEFSINTGHHVVISMPAVAQKVVKVTIDTLLRNRDDKDVHLWLAVHMYRVMRDFAVFGNKAYKQLMSANPGWMYVPTLESDYRIVGKRFKTPNQPKRSLIETNTCARNNTPCSCNTKGASSIATLPFIDKKDKTGELNSDLGLRYIMPGKYIDAQRVLKLKHV